MATHPVELEERLISDWTPESGTHFHRVYALSVETGDGRWIGGDVIILLGIKIRAGNVIGVGSVVTRDIPSNYAAVENPCRVIRKINKES